MHINPRLVYGRVTGWGRTGTLGAPTAGHDINYIALTGALQRLRHRCLGGRFLRRSTWLATFGGGGLLLAFGHGSAPLSGISKLRTRSKSSTPP